MHVITIVAPIFTLIAIGYLAARTNFISDNAQKGLSEFAFKLAMPCLLFRTIAGATAALGNPFDLWLAYFGASAIIWLIATLATSLLLRRPLIDSATIAMSTVYGNTVMIGIPLCLAVYGPEAATPIAIILSIHSPLYWFIATLHHQWVTRESGKSTSQITTELFLSLAKNPLMIGIFSAALWRVGGLGIPKSMDGILALLGQAGIPCALISLGASLTRFRIAGQLPTLSLMLVLKLIAMPALAYWLAVHVLRLPTVAAGVITIFAAMPAGANAYLFAERTGRVLNSTSGVVALGTAIAAVSVALLIANIETLIRAQ
ncbi:MAG: AEC family transporter [Hyphomicrobiaceae bacterium]